MAVYSALSNFGVRYFLEDYTEGTLPTSGTNELNDVLSCTLGEFTKDMKKYKTLNGDGWDVVVPLGQSQADATFEMVRTGEGNAYTGVAGTDAYTQLKHWFLNSVAAGGSTAKKYIVEVIPRGNNTYEGTVYSVLPLKWAPGKKDTEVGQEYSFDVTPFGAPVPVVVTHTPASGSTPESWTFAQPQG